MKTDGAYICNFHLWHEEELISTEIIGMFHNKENACKMIEQKAEQYLEYDELSKIIYKSETGSRIDIKPGNVRTEWKRIYFIVYKPFNDNNDE